MEYVAITKSDFLKYFKIIESKSGKIKAIKNEIEIKQKPDRKRKPERKPKSGKPKSGKPKFRKLNFGKPKFGKLKFGKLENKLTIVIRYVAQSYQEVTNIKLM